MHKPTNLDLAVIGRARYFIVESASYGVFCGWHDDGRPHFRTAAKRTEGKRFATVFEAEIKVLEQLNGTRYRKAYVTEMPGGIPVSIVPDETKVISFAGLKAPLVRCPLCVGPAQLRDRGQGKFPWVVECIKCWLTTGGHALASLAIAAWNRRDGAPVKPKGGLRG